MTGSFDAPVPNVAPGGAPVPNVAPGGAPVPNAPSPDNAFDAPVDRMTGMPGTGGLLGTFRIAAGIFISASVAEARATFTLRDRVSVRIVTVSPPCALHSSNNPAKASFQ